MGELYGKYQESAKSGNAETTSSVSEVPNRVEEKAPEEKAKSFAKEVKSAAPARSKGLKRKRSVGILCPFETLC